VLQRRDQVEAEDEGDDERGTEKRGSGVVMTRPLWWK